MKKTNLYLTLILVALITVILIAGIALIVVLSSGNGSENGETDDTLVTVSTVEKTPAPGTTTKTPSTTPVAPAVTTTVPTPSTTTTVPTPSTTTTVPTPSTTTKPAPNPTTTTKPVVPTPTPGSESGTVTGEKISSLGIYAAYEIEAVDPQTRTATVRVTFYVESYGLQVGSRTTNYLLINGKKNGNLLTERINLPDGSPHSRTVLYEYVTTVDKPDDAPVSLELEYFWHCKLYYSGQYVEYLSVKVDLTI